MIDPGDDRLHEGLLGRTTRDVLARGLGAFAGWRVLVTGGGIGATLALEITRSGPSRLIILEQSEHDLVAIERVLSERRPGVRVEGVLGDVSRRRSVDMTLFPAGRVVERHSGPVTFPVISRCSHRAERPGGLPELRWFRRSGPSSRGSQEQLPFAEAGRA